MPITAFNNTSMTVSDMDRSIEFYRNILGFSVVSDQIRDNDYCEDLTGRRRTDAHRSYGWPRHPD